MVNLKALERSLAKIEEVGKDELAFEAHGTAVIFRTLIPEEEEIVDAYARLAYIAPISEFNIPEIEIYHPKKKGEEGTAEENEDDEDDEDTSLAIVRHRIWLDRLRQATMGFVITEIDGQDLRGVEYIETGEVDENGNAVSILKHEFIRNMVTRWTRPVLTQMFGAYSELMDRVNLKASKLVQFDAADIEEELKRIKQRQMELERHQELTRDLALRTSATPGTAQERAGEANAVGQNQMNRLAEMTEESTGAKTPPTSESPPPQQTVQERRASSIPQPRTEPPPQEPEPQYQEPEPQYQAPQDPNVVPPPLDGDSMFDPSDPDDALEAENRRQEILYRQQQERERQRQQQQEPPKPIIQGQAVRPQAAPKGAVALGGPGELREALNTANVAAQTMPQTQTPVRQGTRKQGGKEVPIYKQPTTTLERRGPQTDASKIQLDQGSSSRNPRFKPAREED